MFYYKRHVELSTFKSIWLHGVPHIKIASPRANVCPKCESLRWYVIGAVSEEAKLTALDDYKSHVEISQDIFISKSTLVSLHLHLCPNHLLSEHIYKRIVEYNCIKINVG